MTRVPLDLPEDEARNLYAWIHRTPGAQDLYEETYRQLQAYFFARLTVDEVTRLLEPRL